MPYFPKFNLLFLHVPKTGGTSVENTLQEIQKLEFFDWKESMRRYEQNDMQMQNDNVYGYEKLDGNEFALQHATFSQIKQWNYLKSDNPYYLIVVRNPYTRMVSEYRWQLHFGYDQPFAKFVSDTLQQQWYKKSVFHQHLLPQSDFLNGISLDNPKLSVVYFEHFAEGMQHYFEEMKSIFPEFTDAKLRRDNDTVDISRGGVFEKESKKPWQSYYTNTAVAKMVYSLYEKDFQLFGYSQNINDS